MIMNKSSVCILLYFQKFRSRNWPEGFAEFAGQVASSLGATITHFSLNYDGSLYQLKKERLYRFLSANTAKLKAVLDHRKLLNLFYYQSPDADVIHNSLLTISVNISKTRSDCPYKQVYIEFPQDWVTSTDGEDAEFVSSLLERADALIDCQYGFATKMLRAKLPAIYFADVYVSTLSRAEILNLAVWLNHRKEFTHKIRGLYWVNLLGNGHINEANNANSLIESLQGLLGSEHVRRLPSGKVLFDVPHTPDSTKPLYELLNRRHLVVVADGTEDLPTLYYMAK